MFVKITEFMTFKQTIL